MQRCKEVNDLDVLFFAKVERMKNFAVNRYPIEGSQLLQMRMTSEASQEHPLSIIHSLETIVERIQQYIWCVPLRNETINLDSGNATSRFIFGKCLE